MPRRPRKPVRNFKARKYAQKEQRGMYGLNINPSVLTLVDTLVDKLTELESHTGTISP